MADGYANVRVDGKPERALAGRVFQSHRDPQCNYFVGEVNPLGDQPYVKVRLVCDSSM